MRAIFIVNASVETGLGHLTRCIELAHALQEKKYTVLFLTESDNEVIQQQDINSSIEITHFASANELQNNLLRIASPEDLIIIDIDIETYHTLDFQKAIIDAGSRLAYFTVNTSTYYLADFIISYNVTSSSLNYNTSDRTQKLTGLKYFIFRKEFRSIFQKNIPKQKSIFVNFGASDPQNFTNEVVKILEKVAHLVDEINIVYGPLYKGKFISTANNKFNYYHNPDNFYELLASSHYAICALGSTFYELFVFGTPCWVVASSQREMPSYEYITRNKMAIGIGNLLTGINDHTLLDTLNAYLTANAHNGTQDYVPHVREIDIQGINNIVDALTQNE